LLTFRISLTHHCKHHVIVRTRNWAAQGSCFSGAKFLRCIYVIVYYYADYIHSEVINKLCNKNHPGTSKVWKSLN